MTAPHTEDSTSILGQALDDAKSLRAELQEVERERERYREALREIADISLLLRSFEERILLMDKVARAALKGERENG